MNFILLIICQISNHNLKLGQPLSEDSGNATKLKGGAGRKKKSGFWNCCSGGSTGSGYPCKLRFVSLIILSIQ